MEQRRHRRQSTRRRRTGPTGETRKERIDRELIELLNELRVALPGVQFLFAFLLIVPFQQKVDQVTDFQRGRLLRRAGRGGARHGAADRPRRPAPHPLPPARQGGAAAAQQPVGARRAARARGGHLRGACCSWSTSSSPPRWPGSPPALLAVLLLVVVARRAALAARAQRAGRRARCLSSSCGQRAAFAELTAVRGLRPVPAAGRRLRRRAGVPLPRARRAGRRAGHRAPVAGVRRRDRRDDPGAGRRREPGDRPGGDRRRRSGAGGWPPG